MTSESDADLSDGEHVGKPAANHDRHFSTDHLKADLKGRSVRGGAITMAAQACRFVLTLGSTFVIARLLGPDNFGVIDMVIPITGFVMLISDMGLSMATIQSAEINHRQISTLFWLIMAIGGGFGLIVASLAEPIAWFYDDARLTLITPVMALGIPIGALVIQHQALLRRQMRFKELAAIDLVSLVIGIVVGISLAALGAGYWALVVMPLVNRLVFAAGVWLMCNWRPGMPVRGSGVRPLLHFGGYLTAFNFVNYFIRNLDNILIGYVFGAGTLGLYSMAYRLLLLPLRQITAPINTVALPVLSRLAATPARYRTYYRQGILVVVALTMPIVVFFAIETDRLVLVALGDEWMGAVPIFRALVPAAFIQTFNVATGWVYISLGRPDRQFRLAMVWMPLTVVAFVIGLEWGAIGVAAAFSISYIVLRLPGVVYCFHGTPLTLRDLGTALVRPTVASLLAGLITFGVDQLHDFGGPASVRLGINLAVYAAAYVAAWVIQPNGTKTLREMLQLASLARRGPSQPKDVT